MKIAILTYSAEDNSGTSLVALDHASMYQKSGHDVTLFTLIPYDGENIIKINNLRRPLFNLPLWKYPFMYIFAILPSPMHLLFINRCLESFTEYDMIIAYDYPLSWIAYYAKNKYKLKYLCFLQGLQLPEMSESIIEKLYINILSKYLYKRSVANADNVIVETEFLKDLINKKLSIRSQVIQNPTFLFMQKNITGENIRNKYQLNDDPVILYIDRLEEHKGVDILLDAFKEVRNKVSNAKLIIIGKCTRKSYFNKVHTKENISVIFIDYVPHNEVSAYYSASNIFATCAIYEEGLSHTIIEAQAFGNPVVAFDILAHREIVKDGKTGILVKNVGSRNDFASALVELLTNTITRDTMSKNALLWAEELGNNAIYNFNKLLE
jgi:glycosyltransferase involved in cell wall biosynthesis